MTSAHLVRRFFAAIRTSEPREEDTDWTQALLSPQERPLFDRLPAHDRRHAIAVATAVETELGEGCEKRWLVVALLHDIGKQQADLSVVERAFATIPILFIGRQKVGRWTAGYCGRVGKYARHGEIGAEELRAAEGSEDAAAWSEAHHNARQTWAALGWPDEVIRALDAADNA